MNYLRYLLFKFMNSVESKMKFNVNQKIFSDTIHSLSSIINRKNTRDNNILEDFCLKIISNEDGIKIYAVNNEMYGYKQIMCDVEEHGSFFINASLIASVTKSLNKNDNATFIVQQKDDSSFLTITTKKSVFNLKCFPSTKDVDQYTLNTGEKILTTKLTGDILKSQIKNITHCISNDEQKINMYGVLIHFFAENNISFISTDAMSLAVSTIKVDHGCENTLCLISKRSINAINSIISSASEIEVEIFENSITIKDSFSLLSINKVDQEFPRYQAIIPPENDIYLECDKSELLNSIQDCISIAQPTEDIVSIEISEGVCKIEFSSDSNKSSSTIDNVVDKIKEDRKLFLYSKTLISSIAAIQNENIKIYITESTKPIMITGSGNSDLKYIMLPSAF